MVRLDALLIILIILFGIVGSMRGWAKELLVTFSVILAMFIISVFTEYVPFVKDLQGVSRLWMRIIVLVLLIVFGYQSPSIPKLAATNRFAKDKLQDALLGLFLGALNGYLIFGSLWIYIHEANYPFSFISPPQMDPKELTRILNLLPPAWLGAPLIYFAVAVAFVFVLVVFL